MSSAYVIVGFENVSVFDLQSAVELEYGVAQNHFVFLGCSLDIEDARETYRMADRLLRQQALEESNSFLRKFDIMPFATEIHLSCGRGRAMAEMLPPLADIIARTLSARLKCQALVRITDGEVPFRLYRAGQIHQDYRTDYTASFATCSWVPASLVGHRHD